MTTPSLSLTQVQRAYAARTVLAGVDLRVEPGEIVGFVGANGAGKTTTMRIALGLAEADSGTVRLLGTAPDHAARLRVGYMPEERGLFATMTPRDQLAFLAAARGLRRRDALRAADAWLERVAVQGAATRLERLSLGNQQRVQLAAALVHDPALLVLDEPFSGLDPTAAETMAEILRERSEAGVGVLLSSHQLDLVERLCDRVCVLAEGRVVADGTVADLTGGDPRGLAPTFHRLTTRQEIA
ncbi:hypothetical protein GCM10027425_04430 [Alteromonas gracilis]